MRASASILSLVTESGVTEERRVGDSPSSFTLHTLPANPITYTPQS